MECPFCTPEAVILSNEHAYVRFDKFPVSNGHLLVIPYRHEPSFFNLTEQEQHAILDLINKAKLHLDDKFDPDGYNVGMNIGEIAGQTILHFHAHLIPRYKGDVPDPRGGVRGVIPEKKLY
ncbi:MAG: HIT family protein [Dehalococcoidales bacterium]|nr:HIT family protein [Dehalococcoidales bacterium]